ncbi:MAG: sulfatase [Proteobacteria bacterium]|nr:sulfatase [Pseudomonadota bacterium]
MMFRPGLSVYMFADRLRPGCRVSEFLLWARALWMPSAMHAPPSHKVLFLIIDDLRPELPTYGSTQVHAPNIERLAQQGLVFHNAYANVPVCGASRGSLLTGLRPTATRFVGFQARMDVDTPSALPLFGALKAQGYRSLSLGKVAHVTDDYAEYWSSAPWNPWTEARMRQRMAYRDYLLPENLQAVEEGGLGPPFESAEVEDDAYFSGQIADRAIGTIEELRDQENPFFLAVGLLKPHLPFNAPKRYWDLYRAEDVRLPQVSNLPINAPSEAWHNWGELRYYDDMPPAPEPLSEALARTLIHGYYASVSYIDALVGRILWALDENGFTDNTIVVFLSDHGWSLGEHGLWAKHSTFDVATRSPLIVRAPGVAPGHTRALIEFADLYPTLMEMLGMDIAANLHGRSFANVLSNPDAPGKEAVYLRWLDAEAIKTPDFALSEWFDEQGEFTARMLYDHRNDRDETINLAEEPEYRDTEEAMHRALMENIRNREVID